MSTASSMAPERQETAVPAHPPARLLSLDALRGFDMFWILGADSVAYAIRRMGGDAPGPDVLAHQLEHVDWAGFHFYDLIFPLFVFIVGVSSVFSLTKIVARHGRAAAVKRILVRAALLFLFGIFYNGGLASEWPHVRIVGVLQRIALAYAAAGLLFIYFRPRVLAIVTAVLLIGYWALLTFVPIRDIALDRAALAERLGPDTAARNAEHGRPSEGYRAQVEELFASTTDRVTGGYDPGRNLTNHLDFLLVSGSMYDTWWDPEGLLSTLPAIATCLLGLFAGLVLQRTDLLAQRKATLLAVAGVVALVAGSLWGLQFPVIKKLWTSSFVLVAAGWSLLLLALFYYMVDMRGWRRWCAPFVWIGMNPITLYLISSAVSVHGLARRLAGGSVDAFFDRLFRPGFGDLIVSFVTLLLFILLARFLYRRQIFLRV